MKAIRTIAITFIVIGSIGIAMNLLFGYNTMAFLSRIRIEETDVWVWKFDGFNYLKSIETSFTDTSRLELNLPSRTWQWQGELFSMIANNLAVLVNYVIVIFNVLLYPLKVGAYVSRQMLALLGMNITGGDSPLQWLIDLINNLMAASITYI